MSLRFAVYTESELLQRIARNFGWLAVSEIGSRGLFFVSSLYLARILLPTGYGLLTFAQAVIQNLYVWVDLGAAMYGQREVARDKSRSMDILNQILSLNLSAGALMLAMVVIWRQLKGDSSDWERVVVGCSLYFITFSMYPDWFYRGMEKYRFVAITNIVIGVGMLGGAIVFIRTPNDLGVSAFVWSLSYLLGAISLHLGLRFIFKRSWTPVLNLGKWWEHLRQSIFFTISGSMVSLYQTCPLLALSVLASDEATGIFAAAYRIVIVICSAGFIVPMSLYPIVSSTYQSNLSTFRKVQRDMTKVLLGLGIPIGIIGVLFARQIVLVLLGAKYLESVLPFQILVLLVPLYFLRYAYGTPLLAAGFQKWHSIATTLGALVAVIESVVLIPIGGTTAAAIATLCAECVIVGSFITVVKWRHLW